MFLLWFLVEFLYPVFTCMPGRVSRGFRSLLLCPLSDGHYLLIQFLTLANKTSERSELTSWTVSLLVFSTAKPDSCLVWIRNRLQSTLGRIRNLVYPGIWERSAPGQINIQSALEWPGISHSFSAAHIFMYQILSVKIMFPLRVNKTFQGTEK